MEKLDWASRSPQTPSYCWGVGLRGPATLCWRPGRWSGGRDEGHGPAPTVASVSRAQSWPPAPAASGRSPWQRAWGPRGFGQGETVAMGGPCGRRRAHCVARGPPFHPLQPRPHSTCLPPVPASSDGGSLWSPGDGLIPPVPRESHTDLHGSSMHGRFVKSEPALLNK